MNTHGTEIRPVQDGTNYTELESIFETEVFGMMLVPANRDLRIKTLGYGKCLAKIEGSLKTKRIKWCHTLSIGIIQITTPFLLHIELRRL